MLCTRGLESHPRRDFFSLYSIIVIYVNFFDCEVNLWSSFFFFLSFTEFVAGEVVHSLIGFTNKGESDFIVTGIEASFR